MFYLCSGLAERFLVGADFRNFACDLFIVIFERHVRVCLENFAGEVAVETGFAECGNDFLPVCAAVGDVLPGTAGVQAAVSLVVLDVNASDAAAKNFNPVFGNGEGEHVAGVEVCADLCGADFVNEGSHVVRGEEESVPYVFHADENSLFFDFVLHGLHEFDGISADGCERVVTAHAARYDATGINFAVQTFSAKIPGAFSTALGAFLLSLTSFVLVEANSIADLAASGVVQTQQAITEMYLVTTLPGIISTAIAYTLLLCFYKLRSKDVAVMAKCNAGELTREQADSMLSRKY